MLLIKMTKTNIILIVILSVILSVAIFFIKYQANDKYKKDFPIFMSTKDLQTNIRSGPSQEYPVLWTYNKQYVPFKVLSEYGAWYNIQDVSGNKGWINKILVSTKRTSIVLADSASIYILPQVNSKVIAVVKKNVIIYINNCNNEYCKITINNNINEIKGWISKASIWF